MPGGIGSKTLVGGNMKRLLILSLAMSVAMPAIAQTQMPVYRDRSGSFQGASGVVVLNADGTPTTGTGGNSEQTQGTAANGATPAGNPNLVAGSDGTNVRTIRTTTNGTPFSVITNSAGSQTAGVLGAIGDGNATNSGLSVWSQGQVFNIGGTWDRVVTASRADATAGTGLLGAGILGQYQTTLPTYTAGQFGTLAMTSRGLLSVSLSSPDGALAAGVSTPADTQTQAPGLIVRSQPQFWNGATWDRVRGDTTGGLYMQERERSLFLAESTTTLAANATFIGATRTGGTSPSQWGTFSCFFRNDQTGVGAMQGSIDGGTTWYRKMEVALTANTPARLTDRNDTPISRCILVNGTTATTFAPVIVNSFAN